MPKRVAFKGGLPQKKSKKKGRSRAKFCDKKCGNIAGVTEIGGGHPLTPPPKKIGRGGRYATKMGQLLGHTISK